MSYKVKGKRCWIKNKISFSSPSRSLQPLPMSVMSAGCVAQLDVAAKPASICL